MLNTSSNASWDCDYQTTQYSWTKFGMLVIVTPVIGIVGVLGNTLSAVVYTSKYLRSPNSRCLVAIAVSDTITISTALALYPVEILIEFYQSVTVSRAWHWYINIVFTISHFGPFTSAHMTVAATIERYLSIKSSKWHDKLFEGYRIYAVFTVTVLYAIVLNCGKYFEFQPQIKEQCDGLGRYYLQPNPLLNEPSFFKFYSYWLHSITSCMIPFCFLLIANISIAKSITTATQLNNCASINSDPTDPTVHRSCEVRKHQVNTVITSVVLAFLLFNLPAVVLSLWEFVYYQFLETHPNFYGFFKDVINILTITSASVNCFIFAIFDEKFRVAMSKLLRCGRSGFDRTEFRRLQSTRGLESEGNTSVTQH